MTNFIFFLVQLSSFLIMASELEIETSESNKLPQLMSHEESSVRIQDVLMA